MENYIPTSDASFQSFDIDVAEAVQILGVSRTRLSQLVSKGVLGFERRRVDTRLRMFFNRTELLSYVRRQLSGASAKVKQNEWLLDSEWASSQNVGADERVFESLPDTSEQPLRKLPAVSFHKLPRAIQKLSSALAIRNESLKSQHEANLLESEKAFQARVLENIEQQNLNAHSIQSKLQENILTLEKKLHQVQEKLKKIEMYRHLSVPGGFLENISSENDNSKSASVKKKIKSLKVKRQPSRMI